MQQTQTDLKSPRTIVHELIRSNSFLEQAGAARTRPEKVKLVSSLALKMSGISNESQDIPRNTHDSDHFLTKDEASMRLFGRIEPFVKSQMALDAIRADDDLYGTRTPRRTKIPHLLNVIRFNHAVSDILDGFSEVSERDIEMFVVETLIGNQHNQQTIAYTRQKVREALWGMNQENGVEQALWECNDVDSVERPTEKQELQGIDRVIIFTDGSELPIDVKASQGTAQRAYEHGSSNNIVVSPFTDEDFHNRRVTKAALAQKLPKVQAAINTLRGYTTKLEKSA